MKQDTFKHWNTLLGWGVFIIALLTYSFTIEPTVSFWDAGEYILTASKLQVGHPPGAPLFQMLGAVFSILAVQPEYVGFVMNLMSAVSSAFAILFMFWSITILLKKITNTPKTNEISKTTAMAILGSSLVGSLAFTFTDSFWFNAVETEVYAMATLIMSCLFWLGLRWEKEMHTPRGNRWLILIAFVIGLSFGVHFMGLLTIPAIALIYYFKNYKTITLKNFIIANALAVTILLFIFKLLAPNILRYFSALEIFFVNTIGLPFNSGSIIAGIILVAAIYYGLQYSIKKNYIHLNTAILCLTFIIIGFSTWLMLPIRANANVVINENNPSSARELLAYYNLEQYPETHLFYGPQFTDQYAGLDENEPYVDDKPKYEKDYQLRKYVVVNDFKDAKQNYNHKHASILPRMWSPENAEKYMLFTGIIDFKIKPSYQGNEELRNVILKFKSELQQGYIDYEDYHQFLKQFGSYLDIEKPSFASNIQFLFQYQLGYMYWRYFMWNFVGRQDDIQGKYDNHGNWLSGITFIDNTHLDLPQKNLPSDVKNNKARNTYYFLPFILGLIGVFFLFNKNKKVFWVLLVFFLFTGIAIQVYTNVRPFEPRERDYSVVGSFYVFSLCIGFGVYALINALKKYSKSLYMAPIISLLCLILVPGILAANNWNDHDRSNRYTARAMAKMYLDSCDENAILFTIGDNDTFALWYMQEIENYRTDVRVVNTSLFQTDWYIDQMKRKAYQSNPLPSQLTHKQYRYGTRDYIMKQLISKDTMDIKDFIDFVGSDNPKTKFKYLLQQEGENPSDYSNQLVNSNYFPVENIRVPVNKNNVVKNGIVKAKDIDKIESNLYFTIDNSAIYKNRLLMLDVVANNNWERPIYFTGGAFSNEDYIWMKDYLQLDGMCYKLTPIKTPVEAANPFDMGRIDSEKMYQIVKKWDWGNSDSPYIYHDVETRTNSITYRGNLARLIEQFINEEQPKKAEEIADLAMKKMPLEYFGYYTLLEPYVNAYYQVNATEKARDLYRRLAQKYQEKLVYYSTVDKNKQYEIGELIITDIERYRALVDVLVVNDRELAEKETEKFNNYLQLFTHFMEQEPPKNEEDLELLRNKDSITIPINN